jgi:hypothetical protein
MRHPCTAALAALLLFDTACASKPRWVAEWSPTELAVAAALDDSSDDDLYVNGVVTTKIPDIPVRKSLRPCCAFGSDIRVKVAGVRVPGVKLENIINADDVGRHQYDSGVIQRGSDEPRALGSSERNGLVYTCRGGFIDTAHLRDYADWTVYFTAQIARRLYDGGTFELPSEGGSRRVIVRPVARELLDQRELQFNVVPIAQWIAFQMSIWHEIATWYGWSTTKVFSERASAFSPEDLYSNLLGTKIAGGIILTRAARTDQLFNANMGEWMEAVFERLDAVPAEAGKGAARYVDQVWWDSTRRVPDAALVLRRNFGIEREIVPWTVEQAYWSEFVEDKHQDYCGGTPVPLVLRNPDGFRDVKFRDIVSFEIDVDPGMKGFPMPRPNSRRITQDDFPEIIEAIRVENREEFGAEAGQPQGGARENP